MLRFIEINNSLLHRVKESQEGVLKSIQNEFVPTFNNDSQQERKALPLKEYSNKFLRENQLGINLRQKQNEKSSKNSRLNNLITKHKFFQKKLAGGLGKNLYVCKTEPNENEYKCFMTSNNFYREREHIRTQTENINPKTQHINAFSEFEQEEWKQDSEADLKNAKNCKLLEGKIKSRAEIPLTGKIEEKISASRALEMYAKIISKDRSDLIQKIKFTNQKKQVKQHKLESRKNLQICQINLLEKQKKMSFVEKVDKNDKSEKTASKGLLKFRKKTRSVDHRILEKQQQNFELKGWEN